MPTTTDPIVKRHRPTEATVVYYDGTEEARRFIAEWIRGTTHVDGRRNEAKVHVNDLLVKLQTGWSRIPRDFSIGLGVLGQPWAISAEVDVRCYDPIGPDFNAVVTRDQAAAMVVAADDPATTVEQLRLYVHQLATSLEAKR